MSENRKVGQLPLLGKTAAREREKEREREREREGEGEKERERERAEQTKMATEDHRLTKAKGNVEKRSLRVFLRHLVALLLLGLECV